MAKSRKSYKLSRYKTRLNKINRNKRSLRKRLRKRRKTKKLRGGMGFNGIKKKLNAIKKNLNDPSSLGKEKLKTLKQDLVKLDKESIEFDGETLNPGDDKYDELKKLIQKYTQIVESKLDDLSSSSTEGVIETTQPDDCKGKRVSSSEILASINEAILKLQKAKKCGIAAPAEWGRRKKNTQKTSLN